MEVDKSLMGGTCANQANGIIRSILRFTAELSQFTSFEPNPSLDKTLSSISNLCHQTDVSPAVEDQVCLLSSSTSKKVREPDMITDIERSTHYLYSP
jgi:hypothetical protein